MISSRGIHRTGDKAVNSQSGAAGAQVPEDDEQTTPWWWVKTIASWTLLCAAVALLAALVVVPRLTGSTAYTVLTGSMEPTYPPGTLIVVKPTPGDKLEAGDVITFQPKSGDPSVTTHRIVSIVYDASGVRKFITKGDAKNSTDPQLIEEQIRGRLIYSVPKVGHINSVLSGGSRSVLVFVIAGGLGAYALWMWIGSIRDRKRKSDDGPVSGKLIGEPSTVEYPVVGNQAPSYAPQYDGRPAPVASYQGGRHSTAVVSQQNSPAPTCSSCGAPWEGAAPPPRPLAYSQAPDPPTTVYPARPHPNPHPNV